MSSGNSHLVIITGASRGYGRSLAVSFARRLKKPLHLVLAARSAADLEETRALVLAARAERETTCDLVALDCTGDSYSLVTACDQMFKDSGSDKYTDVIFVSNAGVLGQLGTIGSNEISVELLESAYKVNLLSPSFMMSEFVKKFKSSEHVKRLAVVNISSLWAVEPAKTFSLYCASKAGMEMFTRSLAEEAKCWPEHAHGPSLKVLNFAPGPLDTQMQEIIRTTDSADKDVRSWSLDAHATGKLVDPEVSAQKCVKLVITSRYETGAHVDYFDQIEGVDFPLSAPTTCCKCTYCDCGPSCSCGAPAAPTPQCDPCAQFIASMKK